LSIATTALLNKQNVFVFGTMGCGKTTFARQILAKLQEEEGIQLVSINPSMISQLQNPAAQSAFVNLLSKTYEDIEYDYATDDTIYIKKRVKNIIFIDEAENLLQKTENGIHSADQAFLLSLMDGELRDILNCQVLFVFNKDKEFLNPAIFRSVRAGVEFHVTPITMERAKKLVTLLKESNLRLRFDAEKFHQFITDVSKDSSGRMYAAAGFTTLADVVSCFTEPELDDAIIEALRGMRIPPKKETTVQTVSTVKAIPAPPKPIVASKGGSPAPPPTAITPVPAVPGLPTKTEQKKKKRRRR
jgi:energy-coupling factor transporter ATP-binding protein EcfA2